MTIERQADALIGHVKEQLDARCAAQRRKAGEQARHLIKQAFRLARQKVARMVRKEREYLEQQTAKANAHLATVERLQRQRRMRILLEKSREALHDELLARWKQADVQQQWMRTILAQACGTLPSGEWEIYHQPGWDPQLEEDVATMVPDACRKPPTFIADEQIEAGVRIQCHGVILDGTVGGLLDDTTAIDARLLAHLELAEQALVVSKNQEQQDTETT